MPAVGACYLYAIEMKLIYPLPNQFDSRNRKLFIPEHYNESFGILTKNILYDVCIHYQRPEMVISQLL